MVLRTPTAVLSRAAAALVWRSWVYPLTRRLLIVFSDGDDSEVVRAAHGRVRVTEVMNLDISRTSLDRAERSETHHFFFRLTPTLFSIPNALSRVSAG